MAGLYHVIKKIRLSFINLLPIFILSICMLFLGSSITVFANTSGGVLSFTFDVVDRATFNRVKPVLSSKRIPATIFAEPAKINKNLTWAITYKELKDLQDNYGWEIGSHTVNHLHLTQILDKALDFELYQSKVDLGAHGLDVKSFATPYGEYDLRVLANIAKYYKSHRGAWGGQNKPPFNDYEIKALSVYNTTDPSEVKLWIEEAKREDKWLILLLHGVIENSNPSTYEYKLSDFKRLVNIVAESGIRTTKFSKILTQNAPNLVRNGSFENLKNGWASNWSRQNITNITIDQKDKGAYPSPKNSLKITTNLEDQNEIVKTHLINIDQKKKYLIKFYENMQDFSAGSGISTYIDEFSGKGEWISGKYLGTSSGNFVGTHSYTYSPNVNTSMIKLQFYSHKQSKFTLFIDQVSVTEIDSTEPKISTISPNDNQFINGLVDIKAKIDDSLNGNSDIVRATFWVDNNELERLMTAEDGAFDSPTENVNAVLDTSVLTDGDHVIGVKGVDAQGNESNDIFTIKVDNIAPITSIFTDPAAFDGQNGWFTTTPSITFTTDQEAKTQYRWDSVSGPWTTYEKSFQALEGEHTLYYRSTNSSGLTEIIKKQVFKVDTKVPSTGDNNVTINRETLNIRSANVTLRLSLSDPSPGSGVEFMRLRNKNGAWLNWEQFTTTKDWTLSSGRGIKRVFAQFKDHAGNESNITSDSIVIYSFPKTILSLSFYSSELGGWFKTLPIITLSRNVDDTTFYRWDSGSWNTYNGLFKAHNGTHTLYYFSVNGLNEAEAQKSRRFMVDNYRPRTYAKRTNKKRKGTRKMIAANLRWKVKDDTSVVYVKLKIQKRVRSRLRVKIKARYLRIFRKYRHKYLVYKKKYQRNRNRTLRRRYQRAALRYKKAMNKYLRVYRKQKTIVYKTVKVPNYRWTSVNKWRSYKWRTRGNGVYRYLVYAKDKAGNGQRNIAKDYIVIK